MGRLTKGEIVAAAIDTQESFIERRAPAPRPDWVLAPQEVLDLGFFFDGAEGSFGVRSSQGALEDELNRRAVGDHAREQEAMENRMRAIRKRKPRKTPLSHGFANLFTSLGLRPPKEHDEEDELPGWAQQYISLGQGRAYAVYDGEVDLEAAGRASHTRARLILVGDDWRGVLFGIFGPQAAKWGRESKGNPDHPVTKLGGSHLAEIAVARLAFENHQKGDKVNPRAQLWAVMNDPARADEMRVESRKMHNHALSEYRSTRCEKPCRRCWP